MKTILFTFALPFALCAVAQTSAQTKGATSAPKADTVMLSEITDGDYIVRKFVVRSSADAGYSVHYKIGTWRLDSALDSNVKAMDELGSFMASTQKDPMLKVQSVVITGYASPDGPVLLNQKLAKGRAQSLKEYADKRFNLSAWHGVAINSVASDWISARESIAKSQVPNKQDVLNIIDKHEAASATERQLKALPQSWKYLAGNILPAMRYAEIEVVYMDARHFERRIIIPKPAPKPEPVVDPCACVDVYESVSGIIVEMPDVKADF